MEGGLVFKGSDLSGEQIASRSSVAGECDSWRSRTPKTGVMRELLEQLCFFEGLIGAGNFDLRSFDSAGIVASAWRQ